jgi:hypothetical protein
VVAGLVDRIRGRRRRLAGDVLLGRERSSPDLHDHELGDVPDKAPGGDWGRPPRRWRRW